VVQLLVQLVVVPDEGACQKLPQPLANPTRRGAAKNRNFAHFRCVIAAPPLSQNRLFCVLI
jgi:hypothetical protein